MCYPAGGAHPPPCGTPPVPAVRIICRPPPHTTRCPWPPPRAAQGFHYRKLKFIGRHG
jgi:hypothetical protein